MRLPRLVLLLAVLMPLLGWAQEESDVPRAPTSQADRLPAPPLVSAPTGEPQESSRYEPDVRLLELEEAEEEYGGTFGRMMLEVLGAVTGGAAGVLAGYGASLYFGGDLEPHLIVTGILLGSAGGVYGAGTLLSGRGGFLPTLLGSAGGVGMALLFLYAGDGLGDNGLLLLPLSLIALMGPIAGYEISHAVEVESLSRAKRRAHAGPRVYPAFGATSRGPALGLAGVF
jgi:hypothetical protein